MRKRLAVVVVAVGLLGCSPTGLGSVDERPAAPPPQATPTPPSQPTPDADPAPIPKASAIEVHMTSATLADDCGSGPKTRPRARKERNKGKSKHDRAMGSRSRAKSSRACEQSSIQLAITSPAGADPADVAVTSVELLLESGKSVGMLTTRAPSVWSGDDGYKPWNEKVEPGQDLSVSYATTQPDWSQVEDRWNQTYTVKAVLSIAGTAQTVVQSVVVRAPTSLPPGVKT